MQGELREKYNTLLRKCGIDIITAQMLINITDSFGYYPGSNDGKQLGINCKRKTSPKTARAAHCIALYKGNDGTACICRETGENTKEVELDIYDNLDGKLPISLVILGDEDRTDLTRRFRASIFESNHTTFLVNGVIDLDGNVEEAILETLVGNEKGQNQTVISGVSLVNLATQNKLKRILENSPIK